MAQFRFAIEGSSSSRLWCRPCRAWHVFMVPSAQYSSMISFDLLGEGQFSVFIGSSRTLWPPNSIAPTSCTLTCPVSLRSPLDKIEGGYQSWFDWLESHISELLAGTVTSLSNRSTGTLNRVARSTIIPLGWFPSSLKDVRMCSLCVNSRWRNSVVFSFRLLLLLYWCY